MITTPVCGERVKDKRAKREGRGGGSGKREERDGENAERKKKG